MMDDSRFQDLADAWGGDTRRWPKAERASAEAFRATHADRAAAILTEAQGLDVLLDRAPRAEASAHLRARVIASAEAAGLRPRQPLFTRPAAWLSGAGWAAACAAGVLFGVQMTQGLHAQLQADSVLYQASIPAYDDLEVLG